MTCDRIVWITLTEKIFLSYDISMKAHDSFKTILGNRNNIPYTTLSCNSYQGTLLQRHMVWSHYSVAEMLHRYYFSHANCVKVSKTDRRLLARLMKASLCYCQVFSLN